MKKEFFKVLMLSSTLAFISGCSSTGIIDKYNQVTENTSMYIEKQYESATLKIPNVFAFNLFGQKCKTVNDIENKECNLTRVLIETKDPEVRAAAIAKRSQQMEKAVEESKKELKAEDSKFSIIPRIENYL